MAFGSTQDVYKFLNEYKVMIKSEAGRFHMA